MLSTEEIGYSCTHWACGVGERVGDFATKTFHALSMSWY